MHTNIHYTYIHYTYIYAQVHAEARQEEQRRAKILFNEEAERAILSRTALALQHGETFPDLGDTASDSRSVSGGPVAPPGPGDPGKDITQIPLVDMKGFTLAEYVLDFGNVIKGQQVQKEFRVTNVGFSQVNIRTHNHACIHT